MSNFGTSPRIKISGENLSVQKGMKLSPVDGEDIVATPPVPNSDGTPSESMNIYQNPCKDFSFQHISFPDYTQGVAHLTGLPANQPDYIADFHFIGLMRSIDYMLRHNYTGKITGDYNTPGSKSKTL